jgi:nucleoside-diphosphate-sugar epimerase
MRLCVQGSPRVAWSPIHVEDLGPVYAAIIAADAAAVKGQAFNVCGDEAVDNGMVAAAVAKVRLLHKTLRAAA